VLFNGDGDGNGDGDLVDDNEGASLRTCNEAYWHGRPRVEQTRQCGKDLSHCEEDS
jgi:hypothetical protein